MRTAVGSMRSDLREFSGEPAESACWRFFDSGWLQISEWVFLTLRTQQTGTPSLFCFVELYHGLGTRKQQVIKSIDITDFGI